MNTIGITVTGIIFLAFTINMVGAAQEDSMNELVDDIEEYNGSIGPDNALYGLKLAFEGLDESFTFNQTEKLEKKIFHSRLRISEAKAELRKKNEEGAKKAFERYEEKVKETEDSIFEDDDDDSGIFNAQKMIIKHQYILERLLETNPNNTGLLKAYNNSIELEDKFEEKTARKLEKIKSKEGKHYLRESKKEDREREDREDDGEDQVEDDREADISEDMEDELNIEAKVRGNGTQVEVDLQFTSSAMDNESIADEILNELSLSKESILNLTNIEESDDEKLRSSLEARAEVGSNESRIKVEYRFYLNETNGTAIIEGIYEKLSSLKSEQIIDVLEIESIEEVNSEEDDSEMDIDDNQDDVVDRIDDEESDIKSDMEEEKDIDSNEPERDEENRARED